MAITNIKEDLHTSSNTIAILFPVGVIVCALLLIIFVAPQSYAQITDKIASLKEQKVYYDNLQKKLSVLQTTSPAVLDQTGKLVTIMPDKNPILSFLAQMKSLAIEKRVVVTDIKSSSVGEFDTTSKKLEFEVLVSGESLDSINALTKDLMKRAPIVSIDELTVSDYSELKTGKLRMSVYWAALPTTLPALTDPLPPFSPEELKTLDVLGTYTLPEFSTLSPAVGAPRENPFN